jgi:CelD/BcsL family acetyltransferase involved in cellulose biosynthesis
MTSWSYQVLQDPAVFDELESWWNGRPGPAATPYLNTEWFTLWCTSFLPERATLEVVVIERDGTVVGALPLMRKGLGWAALSNSHSDVFDLVADHDADVYRAAGRWLQNKPVTRLYRLDGESAIRSVIPTTSWFVDREMSAPYIDLNGGAEGVVAAAERSLRRDIQRRERRLAELGEVVYLDNAHDSLPHALDLCLKLEASGWKGLQGTAIVSKPATEEFYRGLAALAQARGWLRLSALLVAEHLVAFQLDLDYGGRRFSLKGGFDEELSHLSPGKILQWKSLQSAGSLGLATYEFGGEAEEWKLQWTTSVRPRVNVLVTGSRGVARISGAAARIVARRRIKR